MSSAVQGATGKLSLGRMLGYGSGALGGEFLYSGINIFAIYFLTDVALIGAALAGILLMASRLWDSCWDLLVGYISDHTKSRWGQRRPYLLFAAIPIGVLFFLMYQSPALPPVEKAIYYGVIIFLVWTAYSLVQVPYNAMVPNITRNPKERASLVGVQRIMVLLGLIVIGGLTKPIVALFPTAQIGWGNVGLLYGVVIVVLTFVCFFTTRERYAAEEAAGYKLKDSFKLIWKNQPFVMLCMVLLCVFIVFTMAGSVLNYFCKYNLQNEGFLSVILISIFGLGALLLPVWVMISNKIGKKTTYILGLVIWAMCFLWMFFMNTTDIIAWVPLLILHGVGYSAVALSFFSIVAETVEYGEWKQGIRTEGIQYGVYTFIMKLGASVAMIVLGFGLDWTGYVANIVQTQSALSGIRIISTILPFALLIIGAIIMFFYPINEKLHDMMVKEIEKRKQTAGA